MKMTIEWHEQHLENQLTHLESKGDELWKIKREVEKLADSYKWYKKQISEAKALKKDEFDAERFMVGLKCN